MNPLCIIPARGGSKGLPNKHLLELETQPVIDWTIQAARGIPTVVVSSDSNRILERAEVHKIHGVKRSKKLASDTSPIEDALRATVKHMEHHFNGPYDPIIWLQADCPVRDPYAIHSVLKLYDSSKTKIDSVVTVKRVSEPPEWMYRPREFNDKLMPAFVNKCYSYRRQESEPYFMLDGSINVVSRRMLMHEGGEYLHAFLGSMLPYCQVFPYTISLDTIWDYELAKVAKAKGF